MKEIILTFSCLFFMGCTGPVFEGPVSGRKYNFLYVNEYQAYREEVRQNYINEHPELAEDIKNAIKTGYVMPGMTKEQVMATKGKPDDVSWSEEENGIHELWVYGLGKYSNYDDKEIYLNFENGVLTSWQD